MMLRRFIVVALVATVFTPTPAYGARPPARDVITLSPTDPYPYPVGSDVHFVVETKLKNAAYAVQLTCSWGENVDTDGDGVADTAVIHVVYSQVRPLPEALTWTIPDVGATSCLAELGLIKNGAYSHITGSTGAPQVGVPVA